MKQFKIAEQKHEGTQMVNETGIGASVNRLEDARLLTDRGIALGAVAAAAFAPVGLPPGSGAGLESSAVFDGPFNFPNGCHLAEVEADPETGAVDIAAYTAFDDVGVAVNPKLVAGLIHGGVAQGIGQAMMEAVTYDGVSGQMLTGSLMNHALPRAADIPAMELALAPTPSQPPRHQGRRRKRLSAAAAGGDQRHFRCAQAFGRYRYPHAGSGGNGLAGD